MLAGYRIISRHIELSKFVPISGKSQDFLHEEAVCLRKNRFWKYCTRSKLLIHSHFYW